jgi:hypothetical protein
MSRLQRIKDATMKMPHGRTSRSFAKVAVGISALLRSAAVHAQARDFNIPSGDRTRTGTRMDVDPMTITSVDEDRLKQQQSRSWSEALSSVAGVADLSGAGTCQAKTRQARWSRPLVSSFP